jgi:hypothetical protein
MELNINGSPQKAKGSRETVYTRVTAMLNGNSSPYLQEEANYWHPAKLEKNF